MKEAENRMHADVLIILATFNGGQYLPDQLASIERQTFASWRLLVSDDGSSDETLNELRLFRSKHPERVELLDLPPSGSARSNFLRLLRAAPQSRYVALCDQDDVWIDEKLELLVASCEKLERDVGTEMPCLVFSDLAVVDRDLKPIGKSFLGAIASNPARISFGSTLVENSIPGCSMLFNHSLSREFGRYKGELEEVRMHDWWLALIAFSMGAVSFVPERLVLYRQHANNSAGSVKRHGFIFAFRKLLSGRGELSANVDQAKLFYKAHGSTLPHDKYAQVAAFSRLGEMGKLSRMATCLRLGILKQTIGRRIYQLIKI